MTHPHTHDFLQRALASQNRARATGSYRPEVNAGTPYMSPLPTTCTAPTWTP